MKNPTQLSYFRVIDEFYSYTNDVCIYTIVFSVQHDRHIEVVGDAKRHPDDKHDVDTAIMIARARAYSKLAGKLSKRADGMVVDNDNRRKNKATKLANAVKGLAAKMNSTNNKTGDIIRGQEVRFDVTTNHGGNGFHYKPIAEQ